MLGVSGNTDRLPFHPYFTFKDLVTIFAFFLVLALFVFYAPNVMGHSDNYIPANPMQTPPSINSHNNYLLYQYILTSALPIISTKPSTSLGPDAGLVRICGQ